jgi:hypothetical protein
MPSARQIRFVARWATATGIGLGLLASSALTASASGCGSITDPYTGHTIELPCLVDTTYHRRPDPCFCPIDYRFDPRIITGPTQVPIQTQASIGTAIR